MGLGRNKKLQPAKPVRRHQWVQPDDTIHVDTKRLARFEMLSHCNIVVRHKGCSLGARYEKAQVAMEDTHG